MRKLAILGAGSWGTGLAVVLAPRFDRIALWAHEEDLAVSIEATRENTAFLPGFRIPSNVAATHSLETALEDAGAVLGVMPSKFARAVWSRALPHVAPGAHLVSATKGLEQGSLLRVSEVVASLGAGAPAVLSGPTFAREVALGRPTALVVASTDPALASAVQRGFSGPTFRLYTNPDPIGVEIGASLKNVIAIAAGLCQGLELGTNATAALITRGLAEITRLAVALGGNPVRSPDSPASATSSSPAPANSAGTAASASNSPADAPPPTSPAPWPWSPKEWIPPPPPSSWAAAAM